MAGGATVDAGGVRHVALWASRSGLAGPWAPVTFFPASSDAPSDLITGVATSNGSFAAFGSRPSPLHGIPRPSVWRARGDPPLTWDESPTLREQFGGENVVGIGGLAGGPHGFTIAGAWINTAGRSSAVVWRSPDGRSWARNDTDPTFVGAGGELPQAVDVADSTDGVVVVGRAPNPSPADPVAQDGAIWWSGDGARFRRVLAASPRGPGAQISIDAVRVADGRYVAAGTDSVHGRTTLALWSSDDGQRWVSEPTGVLLSARAPASVTALALRGHAIFVAAVVEGHPSVWERDGAHRWANVPVAGIPGGGVRTVALAADSSAVAVSAIGDRSSALWTAAVK